MKTQYRYYILMMLLGFLGCEEILFEEDLSEAEVALIAPSEGVQVENTSVAFSWAVVDQAISYQLQVAKPGFENASEIVLDSIISKTSFTQELVKGAYEWRVRAENGSSQSPYTTAAFTVVESEDFSARKVVLTVPEDNLVTNTADINFRWETVADATSYNIQLRNENDEVIQEETATGASAQLIVPEGVFIWQVRAENTTQNTLYSTRNITVDTTNPQKPITTAPADQSILTDTTVSFTWTREITEGTEEKDSIFIYNDQELTLLVTKDEVVSPSDIVLESENTYYWFIKAFDGAGNQSEASDVLNFTIN